MINEDSSSTGVTSGQPAPSLTLRLLGSFEVNIEGQGPARFETDTARALLAYLAMNAAAPQSRAHLADLFWESDGNTNTGRTNLRSSLRRVRNALPGQGKGQELLLVHKETLQINPEAAYWVDAKAFEALIGAADQHAHSDIFDCQECHTNLEQALELYRGDFLADLTVESRSFEDWQRMQQERYQWLAVHALQILTEQRFRLGDPVGAISAARQVLEWEPWNEEAHRQLMRLYFASGQRSAALAQYEQCCKALFAEFGTVPSEDTDELYAQVAAGQTAGTLVDAANPYVGLAPFGVAEAANYFGREMTTERLIEALNHRSLVVLVGASGSGKSSVLAAGLTATLLREAAALPAGEPRLRIISMRPGNNPLLSLAAALTPYLPAPKSEVELAAELRQGRPWLKAAVDSVLSLEARTGSRADRLLLIVDQLEELYTQCRDPQTQATFIDLLLPETGKQSLQIPGLSIVIAMRVDFLSTALQSRKLADAFQDHTVVLGPMNRTEMQRAIEQPARQRGVAFEPGLVERLLDDVGNEPGSLPLLQFALAQLWDAQTTGWITHAAYVKIDGVKGALAHYADGFYTALPPTEREQVQQIFLALVQPGETNVDTRRFASHTEIGETQWSLVQRMADARLGGNGSGSRRDGEGRTVA
ncbi:MAG: hypothetical protein IPK16_01120 [Anaerolineales bacterium]|nr:hypothetical protein [Anaerolineales bacterium]